MSDFDVILLSKFSESLELEGYNVEDIPCATKYIKIIYLEQCHGYNPISVVSHLDENPKIKEKIGIQENLNKSTIYRKKNNLNKEDSEAYAGIKNAAVRAVLHTYSIGIDIPDHVIETHDLTPVNINETEIKRSLVRVATENWVDELLKILDPLTFYRSEETDMSSYIGICAHCALQNIAPSGAGDTADYLYQDSVPSGRTLLNYIRRANKRSPEHYTHYPHELVNQFYSCFDNFINLAAKLGFYNRPQQLVADTTPIATSSTVDEGQMIGGSGSGRTPARYGDRSFRYQFLSTVSEPNKFIVSVEPYHTKTKKSRRLDNQLAAAVEHDELNIDHISCDKGYYEKSIIKVMRNHLDDNWVICAKRQGEIKELKKNTKYGEFEKTRISIGQPPLRPEPGAFAYPLQQNIPSGEEPQTHLSSFDSTNDQTDDDAENQRKPYIDKYADESLIYYITDKELTLDNKRKLHRCYRNRRLIEPMIGQIRHNHLPYTESIDPAIRYYLIAMSALFYNMHYLINHHPSPVYGVPLDISSKEWLTAIRHVSLIVLAAISFHTVQCVIKYATDLFAMWSQ